eukprot:GEMP01002892.1.p1 GENE.GEMP01002892.1~~GEMP01002892.1.p1  ORF type:complete len:1080 (+),score=285.51 GEMP01002892.1:130-3369(+)
MTTESFRKEVSQKLSALSECDDDAAPVSWPSNLTSSDRKYIHQIASSFGLFTLSEGAGLQRFIKVHKTDPGGIDEHRRRAFIKPSAKQQHCPVTIEEQHMAVLRLAASSKPSASLDSNIIEAKHVAPPADGDRAMDHLDMDLEEHDYLQDMRAEAGATAAAMDTHRRGLPAWAHRQEILEKVARSQVVLISGETGCGKSTQVPQFILDANKTCRILVAQPRRIAATALCQRVVQERGKNDVGFTVPMENSRAGSRLLFCTTSVMRRRLFNDPELKGVTHIVFDEVHERDKLADFALIFLRDLVRRRPDLRLILMSATLQLETFVEYFGDMAELAHIPGRTFPVQALYMDQIVATLWKTPPFRKMLGPGILSAGLDMEEKDWKRQVFHNTSHDDGLWGLAHHIKPYLDGQLTKQKLEDGLRRHDVLQQSGLFFDFPIIQALILHIDRMYKTAVKMMEESGASDDEIKQKQSQPGAVLVFLTGWNDIDRCMKLLQQDLDSKRFVVMPLHGQITLEQQREIFQSAGDGIRKIVLATNIAEASITVPDVEFVIDCGRAKETSYDPYLKIGTLTTSWVSKAAVSQRAGRAGRTKGGLCFHLFSKARLGKLDEYMLPELLRSPLEETCLSSKLLLMETGRSESVVEFLSKAPSPPEQMTLNNAMEDLRLLGAFVNGDDLTHMGQQLCQSSLPPALMKTALWGALFGVLDDVLTVTWSLAFTRDPFMMTRGRGEQLGESRMQAGTLKKNLAEPYASDHIALLRAINLAAKNPNWASENGLNPKNFRGLQDGATRLRHDIPNIGYGSNSDFASRNCGNEALLIAVLAAGLYPNIAVKRVGKSIKQMEVKSGKIEAMMHGTSAYAAAREQGTGQGPAGEEWVVFQELTQMESSYSLKCASHVPNLVMLLMCGDEEISTTEATLLNGWAKFTSQGGIGYNIKDVREGLRTVFKEFCASGLEEPSVSSMEFLDNSCSLISATFGSSFTAKRPRGGNDEWPARKWQKGNTKGQSKGSFSKGNFSQQGGRHNNNSAPMPRSFRSDANDEWPRSNMRPINLPVGGKNVGKGGGGKGSLPPQSRSANSWSSYNR